VSSIRVLTWNVLFGGVGREALLGEQIGAIAPDIACFTEVTSKESLEKWSASIGPYRAVSGRTIYGDRAAIVSRWPIGSVQLFGPPWSPRRWVRGEVQLSDDISIGVVAVHLLAHQPWTAELGRLIEVRSLLSQIAAWRNGPVVLAGDFNAIGPGDEVERQSIPFSVRAQWWALGGVIPRWTIRKMLTANYIDCFRAANADARGFTIESWNPTARIDYVFVNESSKVCAAGVGSTRTLHKAPIRSFAQRIGLRPTRDLNGYASDHLPVWADIEVRRSQLARPFGG
jgi:endonuclease/exonuclease/phosphatase family metal-dependent hydrolase